MIAFFPKTLDLVIGMYIKIQEIANRVRELVRQYGTRDPEELASSLGVEVLPRAFEKQKGAYKVIMRNPFIFIKSDLDPVMERIVLSHELGHHCLHRIEAQALGGFQEFNIFDMGSDRMEYEANVFAAELMLPDEEVVEYIREGHDIHEIASAMSSDINLVALKADALISRGLPLRPQEHSGDFLKG